MHCIIALTSVQTSLVGSLFFTSSLEQGNVFEASAINFDANLLYGMASDRFGESVYVVTMNLTSGNATGLPVTLPKDIAKRERWSAENAYQVQ